MVELMHGDCLELMKQIPDESIDMILCDLPYGITQNSWDKRINTNKIFELYKQKIKDRGAIVLFSQQPFSAIIIYENLNLFRYEWIWEKTSATGFLNAKKMPLKAHENILVFYKKLPKYNPQMGKGKPYTRVHNGLSSNYNSQRTGTVVAKNQGTRFPTDVIKMKRSTTKQHPTQKPVALCEYLIKTYTNQSETVLDNCMGSGTTGVACVNTGRNFIGIELNDHYFDIATERIRQAQAEKD